MWLWRVQGCVICISVCMYVCGIGRICSKPQFSTFTSLMNVCVHTLYTRAQIFKMWVYLHAQVQISNKHVWVWSGLVLNVTYACTCVCVCASVHNVLLTFLWIRGSTYVSMFVCHVPSSPYDVYVLKISGSEYMYKCVGVPARECVLRAHASGARSILHVCMFFVYYGLHVVNLLHLWMILCVCQLSTCISCA